MTQKKRYFGMQECEFEVTRTSKDSAVVEIICEEHDHEEYIIGRIECRKGWGVGQREKGYPHDGDTFHEAVEHCAVMLSEECESLSAIDEVDEFFGTDAVPGLPERLEALAAFLPIFEAHDFEFGRMILLPGDRQYYEFSEEASEFVVMCKVMKWVRPFKWGKWVETPEAISLRDSPGYLKDATHKQLAKLLTALICQEEFVEGSLAKDFESGLLRRIARRASVLSNGDVGEERESYLERDEGFVFRLPAPPFNVNLGERFGLPEGYSAEEAVDAVTCGPYGENTYEIVTPVTHPDGRQIRLTVNESVHYCPHPVKSKYYIHDQDAMLHPLVPRIELSEDQRLCIEDTLREYGVSADFEKSPPLIFAESNSHLIGEPVVRLAQAIGAVSKLSGLSS